MSQAQPDRWLERVSPHLSPATRVSQRDRSVTGLQAADWVCPVGRVTLGEPQVPSPPASLPPRACACCELCGRWHCQCPPVALPGDSCSLSPRAGAVQRAGRRLGACALGPAVEGGEGRVPVVPGCLAEGCDLSGSSVRGRSLLGSAGGTFIGRVVSWVSTLRNQ